MKGLKFCALVLSAGMLLSSCGGNMNNTGKGSLIGAGGGAALGTLIGTLASSNKGKGAGIGAAVGVAVGAGVGALIGKKMDKAKAAAQQVENAQVESVTESNIRLRDSVQYQQFGFKQQCYRFIGQICQHGIECKQGYGRGD